MTETIEIKREKRIRRAILQTLNTVRPDPLSGRMLRDVLESLPDGITSDDEILRLGQDLVELGLARVADTRTKRDERRTIDRLAYTITAAGTALLAGLAPVCPLIEDERRG